MVGFVDYKEYGSGTFYKIVNGGSDIDIQAAINNIASSSPTGTGVVYIMPGTYPIATEITIKPGIMIQGVGPAKTILLDATNMAIASGLKYIFKTDDTVSKNDIVISNIGFKGKYTAGTGITYAVTPGVGGILANNLTRLVVENCYFTKCWNNVTGGYGSTSYAADQGPLNMVDVMIQNNYSEDIIGGFQFYGINKLSGIGNHFYKVGDDAFAVLAVNSGSAPHSTRVTITGNIFDSGVQLNSNGVPGLGIFLKCDGTSSPTNITNVQAANNNIYNSYIAFYMSNVSDYSIADNKINTTKKSGIYAIGSNDNQVSISDNTFLGCNTDADINHAYVQSGSALDIDICGNKLFGSNVTNERGVYVTGNPTRINFDGNVIKNMGSTAFYVNAINVNASNNKITGASNTNFGMNIDSCTNAQVHDNKFYGTYQNYAIQFNNTSTDGSANNNKFYSTNKGIFYNLSSAATGYNVSCNSNEFRNMTGSTTDGDAGIVMILSSTAAVRNLTVDNNKVTDGDTNYYAGINITGTSNVNQSSIHGNRVTGNRYGILINSSGTWNRQLNTDNIFYNNSSSNVNEFATSFTNRTIANNITS